jgi:Flp pilus assembly protein TadD
MSLISKSARVLANHKGKFDEARESHIPALPFSGKMPEIAYHAAKIFSQTGQHAEAARYLEEALASPKPFSGRAEAEQLREAISRRIDLPEAKGYEAQ